MSPGRRSTVVLLAALLCMTVAPPAPIGAQVTPESLAAGTRVRLRAPDVGIPWRTTGVLDSVARDTVHVRDLREPPSLRGVAAAVPLRSIERLEVSTGQRSRIDNAIRGALWGLVVYGAFAGAYIVHESATCRGSGCFSDGFAWLTLVYAVPWAAEAAPRWDSRCRPSPGGACDCPPVDHPCRDWRSTHHAALDALVSPSPHRTARDDCRRTPQCFL